MLEGLLIAAGVEVFVLLFIVWPICAMAKRADIAAAQARHPSNWQPATEDDIEQAVAIVDDGRKLVGEVEAFLKWSADA